VGIEVDECALEVVHSLLAQPFLLLAPPLIRVAVSHYDDHYLLVLECCVEHMLRHRSHCSVGVEQTTVTVHVLDYHCSGLVNHHIDRHDALIVTVNHAHLELLLQRGD
jgi:hypothetical protein